MTESLAGLTSQLQTRLRRYTVESGTAALSTTQWEQAVQNALRDYNSRLAPHATMGIALVDGQIAYHIVDDLGLALDSFGGVALIYEPTITDDDVVWNGWERVDRWFVQNEELHIYPKRSIDHNAVLEYIKHFVLPCTFPLGHDRIILTGAAAEALDMLAEAAAADAVTEGQSGVVTRDRKGRHAALTQAADRNRIKFDEQLNAATFSRAYAVR